MADNAQSPGRGAVLTVCALVFLYFLFWGIAAFAASAISVVLERKYAVRSSLPLGLLVSSSLHLLVALAVLGVLLSTFRRRRRAALLWGVSWVFLLIEVMHIARTTGFFGMEELILAGGLVLYAYLPAAHFLACRKMIEHPS